MTGAPAVRADGFPPGCDRCGSPEQYALSRLLDEEHLVLVLCRRCDAGHPAVRAFDRATDEVLGE